MSVGQDATRAQNRAADPLASTWLTANAGSGKTRVLTDRVARLLLDGTAPEKILCLTYTKAAATEMQNRLLSRLGKWAMLPEAELRAQLADIGAENRIDLSQARRLFAGAIEAPGGLKVQTIHAFCSSVLRRFPLEAGVPHGFTELDDRSASVLRMDILNDMARDDMPEIADLTRIHSGYNLDGWLAAIAASDARMGPVDAVGLAAFAGVADGDSLDALLADIFTSGDADLIAALIKAANAGSVTDQRLGKRLSAGNWNEPSKRELLLLEAAFLQGEKTKKPFGAKIGSVPTKNTQKTFAYMQDLEDLMLRVEEGRPRRIGLEFLENTMAMQRFGHAFSQRYHAAKLARGWLDFDDLITRTEKLLSAPDMAPWVLFRLDGGIDHILVDEAQDTSPMQWQVIKHLTDEFLAGKGQADRRTLFVVGDPKQSIYSFQGADTAVFEATHDSFREGFEQLGTPMQDAALLHSFRSSPAVLQMVDAVFRGEAAAGLGGPPEHIAFHQQLPGRVDLWPVVPKPEKPESRVWDDPLDLVRPEDADAVLADAVADAIAGMIGQPILDRHGSLRPVRAGDILILVQRRQDLFHQIITALKRRDLPVAGADRLKLGGEVAVRDIRALLSFLATQEDDLSLAEVLRSPLIGLSEDDLYRLAAGRSSGEYLWQRMRKGGHEAARAILSDMLSVSGRMRPYEMISRILVRHGGRERLVARLGFEAEDGIDELLSQALAYEQSEPPSLTGFLVWLSGDEVEVRRQPGSTQDGDGLIRVMTVHGSKGLEAPIVFLPDGAKRGASRGSEFLRLDDAPAVLRGKNGERPEALEEEVAKDRQADQEERRRLFYVALTRAESWLVIGAAGDAGEDGESWHSMAQAGIEGCPLPSHPLDTPLGEGVRMSFGDWPESLPESSAAPVIAPVLPDLPHWAFEKPQRPVPQQQLLSATGVGGAKTVAGTQFSEDAMLYGTRLHLLLENSDILDDPAAVADLLSQMEYGLPDEEVMQQLMEDAVAVVTAGQLEHLFAPRNGDTVLTEVALTAPVAGGALLHGVIDRLLVGPDRVLAIDYKSNTVVPETPQQTPAGLIGQMAAYRLALRQIWPHQRIEMAILWTHTRDLMILPDAVLDASEPGITVGP